LTVEISNAAKICSIEYFVTEANGKGWKKVQPGGRSWFKIYKAKISEVGDIKQVTSVYKNWRRSYDRSGQIAVRWIVE
jgi:hypothetical protein